MYAMTFKLNGRTYGERFSNRPGAINVAGGAIRNRAADSVEIEDGTGRIVFSGRR